MIKTLCLVILVFGIAQSTYCAVDYKNLSKDLEIMENILQTALRQKNEKKAICFQSINSIYLADQGILFEVSTTGDRSHFGSMLHSFGHVVPPIPPIPAIQFSGREGTHIMKVDVDMAETERYIEKIEAMAEEFEENSERLHEIMEEQREIEWDIREKKRELKDRNFEMRHAKDKRKKELQKEAVALQKEIASLGAKAKRIDVEKSQYESIQRKKVAEQKVSYKKNVNDFFVHFENVVSDTLCRYGSGLKSLPVEENITFRIKNLGIVENEAVKRNHDKVYVFSKKSVKDCVEDKIDPSKFMGEAHKYIY